MQTFVVDSSVIVKWIYQENEQFISQADAIMNDARKNKIELLAPELAKYEVGNALVIKKKLTPQQAKISLASLYSIPVQFISESENSANETYKIADKADITYYDACFLSLAKQYDATLITDNIKHQGKISEINVTPLSDYK